MCFTHRNIKDLFYSSKIPGKCSMCDILFIMITGKVLFFSGNTRKLVEVQ